MVNSRILLIAFVCILSVELDVCAHGSWQEHARDMREVLGFEENSKLDDWMKFISSDMIDKAGIFYDQLKKNHPGFTCKHRLLFHWGYDAKPWSNALEERVKYYCDVYDLNIESNIRIFQAEMRSEQKRRNRLINERTETLFGFAHGGKDASFARFFAAIAYDTHLVGDYMSDNSDLDGLQDFNSLMRHINSILQTLDRNEYNEMRIGRNIDQINRKYGNNQQMKADALMVYLKKDIPLFVKKAQKGAIYRRLSKKGFKFTR